MALRWGRFTSPLRVRAAEVTLRVTALLSSVLFASLFALLFSSTLGFASAATVTSSAAVTSVSFRGAGSTGPSCAFFCGASVSSEVGISTRATTPAAGASPSRTSMPHLRASAPTTKWPRNRVGSAMKLAVPDSRTLASASAWVSMPNPWSTIATRYPALVRRPSTSTSESGGEKLSAFSTNSASRCATSATTEPVMYAGSIRRSVTRRYSSTSESAARSTSVRASGVPQGRGLDSPASTSRLSALRRIRVARWSSSKRLARVAGSASSCSSLLMKLIWRRTRFWLRRPRLTSESVALRRSTACSVARSKAARWTRSNASATSRTSEPVRPGRVSGAGGRGVSPESAFCTAATALGSRSPAISRACWASSASGVETDRTQSKARAPSAATVPRASRANSSRSRWAALSSSTARFSTSVPSETCTRRSPLMVEVAASHHAMGGTAREVSRPLPCTAVLSYASMRSASGVVRAASSRRSWAAVAERGKAASAASRPARISMKRL
ncbi:hypothetical protein SGRIM119S_03290 [Streptomyces griseorubiginosus]